MYVHAIPSGMWLKAGVHLISRQRRECFGAEIRLNTLQYSLQLHATFTLSSTDIFLAALLNTWSHQWNLNSSPISWPIPVLSNFSLTFNGSVFPFSSLPNPFPVMNK